MYNTNEKILPLSEVRKKERNEKEQKENEESFELLIKAIDFYNTNYPKSFQDPPLKWEEPKQTIKIDKKSSLNDELNKMNEADFQNIIQIFQYFHDEKQMKTIKEHNIRARILAKIKKIYHGGVILEELYKLYSKKKEINEKINSLESQLEQEKEKLHEKLDSKEPKKEETLIECSICGKVCKSQAGLTSHQRVHRNESV